MDGLRTGSMTQSNSFEYKVSIAQTTSVTEANVSQTNAPVNNPDPGDTLRYTVRPGGMSEREILEYFEAHDSQTTKKRVEELKDELQSNEDFDRHLLVKLFQLDDSDKEKELRRLLREIEQSQDLEKIIFGEETTGQSESTAFEEVEMHAKFEFKLSVSSKTQTEDLNSENYVDLRGVEFEARGFKRREADPLVFDLGGDGIESTGIERGVEFDMDGDGDTEKTSFVSGNDYALALDRNGNGFIDSGKELFGDQNGAKDGIDELAQFDDNGDGLIDARDVIYDHLHLVNSDNPSKTLAQAGVSSIDLERFTRTGFTNSGDRIQDGLNFTLSDGSRREALDLYFLNRG